MTLSGFERRDATGGIFLADLRTSMLVYRPLLEWRDLRWPAKPAVPSGWDPGGRELFGTAYMCAHCLT